MEGRCTSRGWTATRSWTRGAGRCECAGGGARGNPIFHLESTAVIGPHMMPSETESFGALKCAPLAQSALACPCSCTCCSVGKKKNSSPPAPVAQPACPTESLCSCCCWLGFNPTHPCPCRCTCMPRHGACRWPVGGARWPCKSAHPAAARCCRPAAVGQAILMSCRRSAMCKKPKNT